MVKLSVSFALWALLLDANARGFRAPSSGVGYGSRFTRSLLTRRASAESEQEPSSGSTAPTKSSSNSNVDLFAANARKAPAPKQSFSVPSSTTTSSSSSSSTSSLLGQQSKNSLQAEILRLEAEIDQLSIDETGLEARMKKLVEIDNVLLELIVNKSLTPAELVAAHKGLVCKEMYFRIAELANNARGSEEKQALIKLCSDLLDAAKAADPLLHAELSSDIDKAINGGTSSGTQPTGAPIGRDADSAKMYDQVLQQWIRQSSLPAGAQGNETIPGVPPGLLMPGMFPGGANATFGAGRPPFMAGAPGSRQIVRFPAAVPFNMLPMMLRSPELSEQDVAILKDAVFTSDVLRGCVVDHSVFLASFRGEPTVSILEAYSKAKSRIDLVPGLSERVRLFLLPEYRASSTATENNTLTERYSGIKFEPVFVALSRQAEPKLAGIEYPAVLLSLLATVATTFIYATDVNSLNAGFVEQALAGDEAVVAKVFALLGGLLTLQLAHEAGHFAMAAVHKVKLGVPFLIPSLQIGIFGAVTRFLSFPSSRKALFDVSIAGPLVGFMYSLAVLFAGLEQTASASPELIAGFPQLPTGFFSSSFLLFQLVDSYLHIGEAALREATSLTPVHPFVVIGMTGVLVNAFNCMPIGRLDGGRVAMAVAGRKSAGSLSFTALLGGAFSLLSSTSPVVFFWLLFVVFMQRGEDLPPEDDVTPLGQDEKNGLVWAGRLSALLFCSVITGLTILPVPIDPALVAGQASNIFGASGGSSFI